MFLLSLLTLTLAGHADTGQMCTPEDPTGLGNLLQVMEASDEAAQRIFLGGCKHQGGKETPEACREIKRSQESLGLSTEMRMAGSRYWAIMSNVPAQFPIVANERARVDLAVLVNHRRAREISLTYEKDVERIAAEAGVDPLLMKAILYYENASSSDFRFWLKRQTEDMESWTFGLFQGSNTVPPMRVNAKMFGSILDGKSNSLHDPIRNLRTAALLIRRIQDRVSAPASSEAIASIYQFLGRERISDYGLTVARIMQDQPWNRSSYGGRGARASRVD